MDKITELLAKIKAKQEADKVADAAVRAEYSDKEKTKALTTAERVPRLEKLHDIK